MKEHFENYYLLSVDELTNINGGFGLAEGVAVAGILNAAVGIFNAGYRFGADLAKRGR